MATSFSKGGPVRMNPKQAAALTATRSGGSDTSGVGGLPKVESRTVGDDVGASSSEASASMKPRRIPLEVHIDFPFSIDVIEAVDANIADDEKGDEEKVDRPGCFIDLNVSSKALGDAIHNATVNMGTDIELGQVLLEQVSGVIHSDTCGVPTKWEMLGVDGITTVSSVTVDAMGEGHPVSTGNFTVPANSVKEGVFYQANTTLKRTLRQRAHGTADIETANSLEKYEDGAGKVFSVQANSPVFESMTSLPDEMVAAIAQLKPVADGGQTSGTYIPVQFGVKEAYDTAKEKLINSGIAKSVHHVDLSNGATFRVQHTDGDSLSSLEPHREATMSAEAKAEHFAGEHHGRAFIKFKLYADLKASTTNTSA